MSKDKSDDDEVYGPPTGDNILPDNPIIPKRPYHKGLAGFEQSQLQNNSQGRIGKFSEPDDDPDQTLQGDNENQGLVKSNQVGVAPPPEETKAEDTPKGLGRGEYGGFFNKQLRDYHAFINMKLVEGIEKTVRANKKVGEDITDLKDKSKEALKEKAQEVNYFYG